MTERKKRLPRARRVKPDERPAMVLTDRDQAMLLAVNSFQVVRGQQLERLFFSSRSTAQYRLQRLFQHEYLDRHFQSVVEGGPASSPILYTLGKRGSEILIHQQGLLDTDIRRFPKSIPAHTLDHLLEVNEVRVAVTLACQAQGYRLDTWLDESVFRSQPDYVFLRDGRGREQKKPVYPDGYFALTAPAGTAHFFLELDRGTEARSAFKPQIAVYEAYTRGGGYQARFNTRSLRILIVCPGRERLKNLKLVTQEAGGDRKYWFTTFDQIDPATILTAPIWERLESDEKRALMG